MLVSKSTKLKQNITSIYQHLNRQTTHSRHETHHLLQCLYKKSILFENLDDSIPFYVDFTLTATKFVLSPFYTNINITYVRSWNGPNKL